MEKIEFKVIDKEGNVNFLKAEYREDGEFSMSGHFAGGSAGQNIEIIQYKNDEQKQLIDFWEKYHLKPITKKQWKEFKMLVDKVSAKSEEFPQEAIDSFDDDKIVALGLHLELSPEQTRETISGHGGITYNVGTEGYFLVCTDEEANEEAKENLSNIIDDMGVGIFTLDLSNYTNKIAKGWFADVVRKSCDSYVQDIESETDETYGNRLIQEMYDATILVNDDFEEGEDGNPNYDQLKSDVDMDKKKEQYVEKLVADAGDPVEYYKDIFGKETFNKAIKEHNLVDTDKLIQDVIDIDGRGHILNGYDGTEYEQKVNGTTYYIYE